MNKTLVSALLISLILWSSAAAAAGPSLRLSYAIGSEDSNIYELNLQYRFKPIFSDNGFDLSPLIRAGGYIWDSSNDNLWGLHASIGASLDMPPVGLFQPFLTISGGPGRISRYYFNGRNLGGHMIFRVSASLGLRFGNTPRHSVSFDYVHYSNAYTYDSNPGFDGVGLSYSLSF